MTVRGAVTALVLATAVARPVASQEADDAFTTRYAFKSSALFSRLPDAPLLFPDRNTAAAFWRLRVEPTARAGRFVFEAAVETRARAFSAPIGGGAFLNETPAPWRLAQLDWTLASAEHAEWRLEIDRAAVHARYDAAELTVGRQAIGWGRGVLFGAVDLFSPFGPLEPDREWRRGVDAARADVRLADRVSLDLIAARGETRSESIYAARLRGYGGTVDLEVMGGWRARDTFGGATSSVAVRGTELHGELAVFGLADGSSPLLGSTVVKALAGGSWRVPLGTGLLVFAEYHYSGFGAPSAADAMRYLADPDVRTRYARGDMQTLMRHATAVTGSYEASPELTWAFQWLQSPLDGSGVIVPTATITFSDRASFIVTGYVPWGRTPDGAALGSDFGGAPLALFTQLRLYR